MATLTYRIKLAWWARPYLYGVTAVAWLTGREPDADKVYRRVQRGIRLVKSDG